MVDLIKGMEKIGFQASGVSKATRLINEMVRPLGCFTATNSTDLCCRKTGEAKKERRPPYSWAIRRISSPPVCVKQFATWFNTNIYPP